MGSLPVRPKTNPTSRIHFFDVLWTAEFDPEKTKKNYEKKYAVDELRYGSGAAAFPPEP